MEVQSIRNLSDKELLVFYKFLCEFETKISKNQSGYNFAKKEVTEFLKKKKIKFEPIKDSKIVIEEHEGENRIMFYSYNSICYDFFRHLRNTIAHAHIYREQNNYVIEDIYHKKWTMYGRVNYKLLKELIEILQSTKKDTK